MCSLCSNFAFFIFIFYLRASLCGVSVLCFNGLMPELKYMMLVVNMTSIHLQFLPEHYLTVWYLVLIILVPYLMSV